MGDACSLADRQCVPCRGGIPPLAGEPLADLSRQTPAWTVVDGHHIERTWKFPDFRQALAFVNRIGALAEEQGHHPDIFLTWGEVRVKIFTHKIDGLSESDFILAAKIDRLQV
ncbi:MAG: 4a-hydroxytetrahydrobiopterin dehydratase [bacterium]